MRQLSGNPNIYHHNLSIRLSRQSVNRRPAMQKIKHHLRSHFSRISTHTLHSYPMIGSHHNDSLALNDRLHTSRHTSHPNSNLLQPSQTSRRLCQLQLTLFSQCHHLLIKWLNPCGYLKWINCTHRTVLPLGGTEHGMGTAAARA